MVGSRTALYDNPRLNTRFWSGRSPLRIVIDKNLLLSEHLHLFDKSQPTVIYNYRKQEEQDNLYYVQLPEQEPMLPLIMQDLHRRNVLSVMVEGGTFLLESLLQANLWDEALVFRNRLKTLGSGIKAPAMAYGQLKSAQTLGPDLLFHYVRHKTLDKVR
jgi:diaminohydroxyphosphoribosylaminopyrimidine deaminase/5-amino-6-(5-phosphoribosylamino)uracil reductase